MERETRVVGGSPLRPAPETPSPPISRNGGRGRREKGPGSTPLTRCRARVLSPAALSVPAVEARGVGGSGTGFRVSMVVVETGS